MMIGNVVIPVFKHHGVKAHY